MANAVVSAILAATTDAKVRAAMLMGSRLESGWNTTAVGDNGSSFGPFQIHLPAHPGVSSAEAENAGWAVSYMLPAYQAGVAKVPSSLWSSNPAEAAATAAFYAERPLNMYSASNYTADWTAVKAALAGQDVGVASGFSPLGGAAAASSGLGSSSGATGITAADLTSVETGLTGSLDQALSDTLNYFFMGALVVGGVVMMTVGLILLFKSGAAQAPTGLGNAVLRGRVVPTRKPKVNVNVKSTTAPSGKSGSVKPTPPRAASGASRTAIGRSATTASATRQPTRRPAPGVVHNITTLPANRKAVGA